MILGRCVLSDGREVTARVEDGLAVPVADAAPLGCLDVQHHGEAGPIAPSEPVDLVRWLTPVQPASLRDFMAFEEHLANVKKSQGAEMDPSWYEQPCFYFANHHTVIGHDDPVRVPRGTRALDYELEVAAVIGTEARDLDPDDPTSMDAIAGFTLMNDWSARDLQGRDMRQQLGPGKGKDFATSLGPWMITPDQLPGAGSGRPQAEMRAFVNGAQWSAGELGSIHFSWPVLLAYASANAPLMPGDIIGSGTCGTGCILELRAAGMRDERPWLRVGDVVELELGGLGRLRNTIEAGDPRPF